MSLNVVGLLPYSVDFSALGDGVLPSPWDGATWAIDTGQVKNTPVPGSDVWTNGNMETGSPPTGYTASNATLTADGDAHGGSQALKVVSTAGGGNAIQNVTVIKDTWYVVDRWIKKLIGVADHLFTVGVFSALGAGIPYHVAPASYTEYISDILTSGTTVTNNLRSFNNADSILWDDITFKRLTWSELINVIDFGNANLNVKAYVHYSANRPVGVVSNADSKTNPKYMVFAIVAGRSGVYRGAMFAMLNGVCTQLIDEAITYADGEAPEIRKTAADIYQLWYNGAQVGADKTVTDATLNAGTLYGLFSTGGGSRVDSFFAEAA